MIYVSVIDSVNGRTGSAEIPAEHAPALRSAINEIRNELGGRNEGAHKFKKEHSLTRASSAMGRLAAAINTVITEDDPDYE